MRIGDEDEDDDLRESSETMWLISVVVIGLCHDRCACLAGQNKSNKNLSSLCFPGGDGTGFLISARLSPDAVSCLHSSPSPLTLPLVPLYWTKTNCLQQTWKFFYWTCICCHVKELRGCSKILLKGTACCIPFYWWCILSLPEVCPMHHTTHQTACGMFDY